MSVESINGMIENVPNLLQYFVPGYILIWVFSFITSKKKNAIPHIVVVSVVLSYIIMLVTRLLFKTEDLSVLVIFGTSLSIISGYLLSLVNNSTIGEKTLKFLRINKSMRTSIWDDLADTKNGVFATVFLSEEDVIYTGNLKKYDYESEISNYIVLSHYSTYSTKWEPIGEQKNECYRIMIKLDNVSRVEYYYSPESRVVKTQ